MGVSRVVAGSPDRNSSEDEPTCTAPDTDIRASVPLSIHDYLAGISRAIKDHKFPRNHSTDFHNRGKEVPRHFSPISMLYASLRTKLKISLTTVAMSDIGLSVSGPPADTWFARRHAPHARTGNHLFSVLSSCFT